MFDEKTRTAELDYTAELDRPEHYALTVSDIILANWVAKEVNGGIVPNSDIPVIARCWSSAQASLETAYRMYLPEDIQRQCWTVGLLFPMLKYGNTVLDKIYFNTLLDEEICGVLHNLAKNDEGMDRQVRIKEQCGIVEQIVEECDKHFYV